MTEKKVHHLVAKDFTLGGSSKPRRARKPTLASELRQAKKAGLSVKGATIEQDKLTLTFGEPTPDNTEVNPWDTVLKHAAH
jgi:hypothetical protein